MKLAFATVGLALTLGVACSSGSGGPGSVGSGATSTLSGFAQQYCAVLQPCCAQAGLTENAALCAVILREARNLDPLLTQEVHDKNRLYTGVVKEIVAQGIQSGEIRPDASAPLIRNIIFGTTEHFFWDKLIGTANRARYTHST